MATVAGIVEIMSSRIDKLRDAMEKLDADVKSGGNETSRDAGGDGGKDNGVDLSDLKLEIESVRKEVRDSRDDQAASFKKERSVSEAVLTQKLDRMVGDKNAALARKVDQACETIAKLSEKSVAITAAVDKQAKFLMELNAGIAVTIDKAVERAMEEKHGGSQNRTQVQVQATNSTGETEVSIGGLEDSPDLAKHSDSELATAAHADGDQIDMVPVSDDHQAQKKPKGKSRKKVKASEEA